MISSKRIYAGFTLLEIMIVVVIVALLALMALPAITKSRETAQKNVCISNLRQIYSIKEQWAIDNNAGTGVTPPADVLNGYETCLADYAKNGLPCCPTDTNKSYGTSYRTNPVGTDPECLKDITHVFE